MKANPAILVGLGAQAVTLWASYMEAMRSTQRGQPPSLGFLIAPTFANLHKPCMDLLLSKSHTAPVGFNPSASNLASWLRNYPVVVPGCENALKGVPFTSCFSTPVSTAQPIHDWLLSHPQQQQQLFQHLGSREFSWFLWHCVGNTVASLELFARGQSPALGCALPQEDYAARSTLMGPVVPVKDFNADGMKQHVNCLQGVLRAHQVLLPCERVLAFLTACQQQQQGLPPSYSSSSRACPPVTAAAAAVEVATT